MTWILKQFQKLAEKKVGAGKQAGRCLSSKLIGVGEHIERFLIRQTFNSECVYSFSKWSVAQLKAHHSNSGCRWQTQITGKAFEKTAHSFTASGIWGRKLIATVWLDRALNNWWQVFSFLVGLLIITTLICSRWPGEIIIFKIGFTFIDEKCDLGLQLSECKTEIYIIWETTQVKDNQTQKSTPKQNEQLLLNGMWASDKKINIDGSPPIALEASTSI